MGFKERRTVQNEKSYMKEFESDTRLTVDQIIRLLKNYENEDTELYQCIVDTYTEEGNVYHPCYKSSEELDKIKELPNPSMSFHAFYIDKILKKYKFEITTYNNADRVRYYINYKTADNINKEIKKNKMLEEEKKIKVE